MTVHERDGEWTTTANVRSTISFEPLPGNVTAPMDVYLWRTFEHLGEPTDAEEVGRVEWVSLARAGQPDLASGFVDSAAEIARCIGSARHLGRLVTVSQLTP